MFDIGFWELFVIAIVALVVVGPERLPKLVRVTGLWIGRANASLRSIKAEISQELRAEELKQALNKTVDLDEISTLDSNSILTEKQTNDLQQVEENDSIEKIKGNDGNGQ